MADRIDEAVIAAAQIILKHEGKIVVSGVGKSGLIGQKIVATLCSTGTPAVFLHASDALHGDLGVYRPGDPTILISKSGATDEIVRLMPLLREFKSPLIGIVGNTESSLAKKVDVVLDSTVSSEADPLGVVPTNSTTVTMAIGDALASVLMTAKKFNQDDFARFHPGGNLGRRLKLLVKDIMTPFDKVAVVKPEMNLKEAVLLMTKMPQGAAIVSVDSKKLTGIMTDGDLRRGLADNGNLNEMYVSDVMSYNPIYIYSNARLQDAVSLMEDRASQISVLPVLEEGSDNCVGLLRLHDIYQSKLI
ncbi:MAG: KpsF/GutQ family sugar-phosphate isomerase [Draconibacterium sp.]|nr:KpsF/GutQ family sugar-phosphate isomerase [Draconibacterium sp.]